jgi:hypothetical protein
MSPKEQLMGDQLQPLERRYGIELPKMDKAK